jgi:hypothetical protein
MPHARGVVGNLVKKSIFVPAAQGKAKRVNDNRSLLDDFSRVKEHWD